MSELLKKLETYADSDYLPMHMPGHKRHMEYGLLRDFPNPFSIDPTGSLAAIGTIVIVFS